MADVNLALLTDEDIIDYTRSEGKDRIIKNHKNLNLRFDKRIQPIQGGVYDTEIFGSPYEDRCVCGHIRQVSAEPCPNCGARVFSKEEALRRFARIELKFYYLNDLRYDVFKDLFDDIFKDCKIKFDFLGDDLRRGGYGGRGAKKLGQKIFDTCQFEYNKTKKELVISEFITDESKCSYEGLLKIIEKNFPDRLIEFKKLINRYYLVLPAVMRPFNLVIQGKFTKKMTISPLSIWYSIVARLCSPDVVENNPQNIDEVLSQFKTPGERVRYIALLRALLNSGKKQATELLNTSKKNKARELYAVNVKNSARSPIVPSTTLKVDELGVPRHLAYEMCRESFAKYLRDELNFTKKEALKSTREEADNPEVQRMFQEYAEQQFVLMLL